MIQHFLLLLRPHLFSSTLFFNAFHNFFFTYITKIKYISHQNTIHTTAPDYIVIIPASDYTSIDDLTRCFCFTTHLKFAISLHYNSTHFNLCFFYFTDYPSADFTCHPHLTRTNSKPHRRH